MLVAPYSPSSKGRTFSMHTETMSMLVRCEHLSFGYSPRRKVLKNLSFTLHPGVTALLGANGAGKSTFMRILATELPVPSGASVTIAGMNASSRNLGPIRSCIGWVPQEFPFDRHQRVSDAVSMVASLRGVPRRQVPTATAEALEKAELLDHANRRLGSLSGGLRRRAVIAAGIVHSPGILLLDEPTAGLDPDNRTDVIAMLTRCSQDGTAILMSTHLSVDVESADRAAFLRDGAIQHIAAVEDLLREYPSIDAAFTTLSRGQAS